MSQDVDNAWSFDHFARNFAVDFNSTAADGNDIEFDVRGVDPAIMNAVRRILISEARDSFERAAWVPVHSYSWATSQACHAEVVFWVLG